MSNELVTQTEAELIKVLGSSLYPGAKPESIGLVLGYCKASGLDPMLKPVHIVPMWNPKRKELVDVVMPGVGLYRITASRTGELIGVSEPEYGPMITENIGGIDVRYPEWAKVTVKRMVSGKWPSEFTACEYWIENYAVKGGADRSIAPNAMWLRRVRGQLGKCAEAQALRKAFPEVGSQPTAEEMIGRTMDQQDMSIDDLPPIVPPVVCPPELLAKAQEAAGKGMAKYGEFFQALSKDERKQLAPEHDDMKAMAAAADAERTVESESTVHSTVVKATENAPADPWVASYESGEGDAK